MTAASVGDYADAVDDLGRALSHAPHRADILVLRASDYRFLDQREAAQAAVEAALALDPPTPEVLLERGHLRRLADKDAGSRDDSPTIPTDATDNPASGRVDGRASRYQ